MLKTGAHTLLVPSAYKQRYLPTAAMQTLASDFVVGLYDFSNIAYLCFHLVIMPLAATSAIICNHTLYST